jgi:hypothetical protein
VGRSSFACGKEQLCLWEGAALPVGRTSFACGREQLCCSRMFLKIHLDPKSRPPAAIMFRMNGMPRAQGCAGAAMFRMNGMPRAQGCAGAAMFRMPDNLLHFLHPWRSDAQERPLPQNNHPVGAATGRDSNVRESPVHNRDRLRRLLPRMPPCPSPPTAQTRHPGLVPGSIFSLIPKNGCRIEPGLGYSLRDRANIYRAYAEILG